MRATYAPGERVHWTSGGKGHFGYVNKAIRGHDGVTYLISRRRDRGTEVYVHETRIDGLAPL